jgi:hypothetical protein
MLTFWLDVGVTIYLEILAKFVYLDYSTACLKWLDVGGLLTIWFVFDTVIFWLFVL